MFLIKPSHMELMSVLMSVEGEKVLLVLICQPPVANQPKVRLFIKGLPVQFEELHIDKHKIIVLGHFNLDKMHNLTLTCTKIFLLTLQNGYHSVKLPAKWLPLSKCDHFVLLIDL